jgi:sulfite reductase (NADPH) hemoprotein beta-component
MICCPGLDFCSLANARSIPIAAQINERFDDLDHLYDLGEIQLKMSGCMNGCGHHSVGHIGILGVDKSGEEWYQITLGGSTGGHDASLGEVIGPSVAFDEGGYDRAHPQRVRCRAARGRALPRHFPPRRRGTFQG